VRDRPAAFTTQPISREFDEAGVKRDRRWLDGAPLMADDAEVAIIGGHVARLATDVLIRPDDSAFPMPAYEIGLRRAWIFSEPFETWPIQLVGSEPWKVEQDSASVAESLALLREPLARVDWRHKTPFRAPFEQA
jgi:hypothetical protein